MMEDRGTQYPRPGVQSSGRDAMVVLILMMASQVINHFDRAVVAIASADIMRDLGLSLEQYGLLASAFYSLFAISGLLVGMFIAHRVPARSLVIWLVGFWTIAQLPALLFPSFGALLLSRVILGAAESPGVAAAVAVTHEWYPPDRRSLPTSAIFTGSMLGAVLAPPVLIAVVAPFGWKAGFLACTIASALLFFALLLTGRNVKQEKAPRNGPARGPWWQEFILAWRAWADPRIVMITIVAFLSYWVFSFSSSWLFPMLHLGWGYGEREAGWVISVTYLLAIPPLFAISALSQRLLSRGASFRRAVIFPTAATLAASASCLVLTAMTPEGTVRLVLMALAFGLLPSVLAAFPIMVSHIAPEGERNRLLLMVLTLESSAGMVAPYVSGLMIDRNPASGFDMALIFCGGAAFLGALLALTLFRRPAPAPAHAPGA